jgi:lipoate-protein ligase B
MPTSSPSSPKAETGPREAGGGAAKAAPAIAWRWLGRQPFAEIAALQEDLRRRILAGENAEEILFVEHPPTVSLGRSASGEHVLASPEWLAARDVAVVRASRGGEVTYHGPGQLVAYPVVRLRTGVLAHVQALADGVVALLSEEGVEAIWKRAHPGVWVSAPRGAAENEPVPAKIAAVGINVHQRVAIHGIALNVSTDLSAYRWIVPCGQPGGPVTSLSRESGGSYALGDLAARLAGHLASALGRELR